MMFRTLPLLAVGILIASTAQGVGLGGVVTLEAPAVLPADPPSCDGLLKICTGLPPEVAGGTPVAVTVIEDPEAGGGPAPSSASTCTAPCPDLSVDLPRLIANVWLHNRHFDADDCNVEEGSAEAGDRRVLRFTTKVPNLGDGHLDIGSQNDNPSWFTWGDCHDHWHLTGFADYRLWNVTTYAEWKAERLAYPDKTAQETLDDNPGLEDGLEAGRKQGFCLMDVELAFIVAPLRPSHHPGCGDQGISSGWSDVYGALLDGQFIDVTDVAPGTYVLEIEVNPERFFGESDYTNNHAAVLVPVA